MSCELDTSVLLLLGNTHRLPTAWAPEQVLTWLWKSKSLSHGWKPQFWVYDHPALIVTGLRRKVYRKGGSGDNVTIRKHVWTTKQQNKGNILRKWLLKLLVQDLYLRIWRLAFSDDSYDIRYIVVICLKVLQNLLQKNTVRFSRSHCTSHPLLPLQSKSVTVWCEWILFFRGKQPNFFFCFGMLLKNPGNTSATELRIMGKRVRSVLFQWGDAAAHKTRHCMTLRIGMVWGRFISCFGYIRWPACSPDLRYLDFFLWRYLNCELYAAPYQCTQK